MSKLNFIKKGDIALEKGSYKIPALLLSEKFKSKNELYDILDISGGFYLPPKRDVDFEFLRKFFAGSKKLFKKRDVWFLEKIPRFEEIKIDDIWAMAKDDRIKITKKP